MKYLIKKISEDSFQKKSLILLSLFVIICYLFFLFKARVNPDASYYINVSRLILDGKVPFHDFCLGYSPLSFYLMCIPFYFWGISFKCSLVVLYIIHLLNAIIVYNILKKQRISSNWAWYGGLLYLLCCMLFQGMVYVLEPFVLLFGLLAILFVQKESKLYLLLAGLACSCSFLCKQYGIGFVILACVYIIIHNHYRVQAVKKNCYLFMGFAIGICLFVVSIMLQNIDIPTMLDELSGSDYHKDGMRGFFLAYIHLFMRITPLLVSIFFALLYYRKFIKDSFWQISILGILGFMLACYVRLYSHYILLSVPFAVFLIIYTIPQIPNETYKKLYITIVKLSTLIPICLVLFACYNYYVNDDRCKQEQISELIENYIPKKQTDVFTSFDVLYVSLLNLYTPPLVDKYGLSSGFIPTKKGIKDMLTAAEYSVISEKDLNGNTPINSPLVKEYLNENFFIKATISNDGMDEILLFKRK